MSLPYNRRQRQFLDGHRDWLPELRRLIYAFSEQQSSSPGSLFYRTVADATLAIVSYDRERFITEEMG